MYSKYKKFIEKYIDITSKDWEIYKSKIHIEHYSKGQIIHHAGDVCSKISFINTGLARAYMIGEDGKDYTWNIMFNDNNAKVNNLFVVDYYSFITQKESMVNIEVIEDCELLVLEYDVVQSLHKTLRKEERLSRLISEIAYATLYKKIVDRQMKTSQERFDAFMQTTPYLLDKVPQYHIATYLGMTPQYLSQLKKDHKY
jgi:CRP-like cAMP-binding protein